MAANVLQDQVAKKVVLTRKALLDAVDNIRGAVMMAFPQGLPEWDFVRQAIEGQEDLSGTSVSASMILLKIHCKVAYCSLSVTGASAWHHAIHCEGFVQHNRHAWKVAALETWPAAFAGCCRPRWRLLTVLGPAGMCEGRLLTRHAVAGSLCRLLRSPLASSPLCWGCLAHAD